MPFNLSGYVVAGLVGIYIGRASHARPAGLIADWFKVLLFTFSGGILGGGLASLEPIDVRELILRKTFEPSWRRTCNVLMAVWVGCVGGIGGAAAALFVMILDNKTIVPPRRTTCSSYNFSPTQIEEKRSPLSSHSSNI